MSQVEQEYDGGNSCINCGEELEEFDTDICWCCEQETVHNIATTMVSGIMCTKCNVVLEPHLMSEHLDKNNRVHCCKTGHKRTYEECSCWQWNCETCCPESLTNIPQTIIPPPKCGLCNNDANIYMSIRVDGKLIIPCEECYKNN